MRILALVHMLSYPPESGATKRIFHLLRETVSRHDVSIIAFGTPDEAKRAREFFGGSCTDILFVNRSRPKWMILVKLVWLLITGVGVMKESLSKEIQSAIDEMAKQYSFDLVAASSPVYLYYRLPAGVPVVADTQNVEYEVFFRTYRETTNLLLKVYSYLQYRMVRKEEIKTWRRSDVMLATSERDKEQIRGHVPQKPVFVVPNGVDVGYFVPAKGSTPEPHSLVFTGVMNYFPNDHGILYFLDRVFPLILRQLPDVRITIVGSNPSRRLQRHSSGNVTITGYVPDVRPYMARSSIYVIPLLVGGGTRLKALEAMAMKIPIVSTTIGVEGINIRDGESVLCADTPERFAQSVVRLCKDDHLRQQIAETAFRIALAEYSWSAVGRTLEDSYHYAKGPGDTSGKAPDHMMKTGTQDIREAAP
jgi:glycosyltransferase involved in cell wall biosynthesis